MSINELIQINYHIPLIYIFTSLRVSKNSIIISFVLIFHAVYKTLSIELIVLAANFKWDIFNINILWIEIFVVLGFI